MSLILTGVIALACLLYPPMLFNVLELFYDTRVAPPPTAELLES
jgi:hypothetical protein